MDIILLMLFIIALIIMLKFNIILVKSGDFSDAAMASIMGTPILLMILAMIAFQFNKIFQIW